MQWAIASVKQTFRLVQSCTKYSISLIRSGLNLARLCVPLRLPLRSSAFKKVTNLCNAGTIEIKPLISSSNDLIVESLIKTKYYTTQIHLSAPTYYSGKLGNASSTRQPNGAKMFIYWECFEKLLHRF